MTPHEYKSVLRPWLDRQPFVPFAFVLTNGESREVFSRSAVQYPDGAVAYLADLDDPLGDEVNCESVDRIVPLSQREITVMTPEAFFNELRRLCDRGPFRPFIVELVSGERIEIDDPEGLAFAGGYATFIPAEEMPIEFDFTTISRIIESEVTPSA